MTRVERSMLRRLSLGLARSTLWVLVPAVAALGSVPLATATAETTGPVNQCVVCHLELEDDVLTPPAQAFDSDIHVHADLTCAGCHGGDESSDDEEIAMDPARGFVGKPDPADIPALCGRCHSSETFMKRFAPSLPTDQEDKFWTSGHGQALRSGSGDVATCISCHGVHSIRKVNDPGSPVYPTNLPKTCDTCHGDQELMARYQLTTDPFEKYAGSVHGIALLEKGDTGAPACNDCHGSHGAQPPGVEGIHYVCGTCHLNNREFFARSPHATAFPEAEIKECTYCHNHHDVQQAGDGMLGMGERGICADCHDAGDTGGVTAIRLAEMVDSLRTAQEVTGHLVEEAEQRGMPVEEAVYLLAEGHESLVKMRTAVHAFSVDAMSEDYQAGTAATTQAHGEALRLIGDFGFRRRGLIISIALSTLLILLVVLAIRRVDRRNPV